MAIPFLEPNRERLLEYDITRAIVAGVTPEKPVVGVMSALPVFGDAGESHDGANGPAPAARRGRSLIS